MDIYAKTDIRSWAIIEALKGTFIMEAIMVSTEHW